MANLVELSLSVAALAADFACIMSMADPDTMTLKEALKKPDAEEFLKAMVKEVEDHVRWNCWRPPVSQVPFVATSVYSSYLFASRVGIGTAGCGEGALVLEPASLFGVTGRLPGGGC